MKFTIYLRDSLALISLFGSIYLISIFGYALNI